MTTEKPGSAIDTPLSPIASELARQSSIAYAEALILQAKVLAFRKGEEQVLSSHMNESINYLRQQPQRALVREVAILFSGAVFSGSFQGFIVELSSQNIRPFIVVVWVVLAFVSALVALWGLFGPRR
jgi:hypothetical protein